MGQIVKRKKKGRPSKADLARRSGDSPATSKPDLRRSLRRRNVKYNIEYDDYLEEDNEGEEEDERRREKKKLKLVVKLNQGEDEDEEPTRVSSREYHAQSYGSASEEDTEKKPLKKRKVSGGRCHNEEGEEEGEGEEEENEEAEDNEDEDEDHREDDSEVKDRKKNSEGLHSVSGTPVHPPSGTPLPDKRTLELILDKLQKKDTYGVYAEPVDPEELPDYHDVIEHPMDFATVRKKLSSGSYTTLEQFESDVFLICSNAMQYNAPETIYHKQARSIQELGRKKFEKLRIDFERSLNEQRSEQKTRSNPMVKKQARKTIGGTSQEHVGSDFSSGATLATVGDIRPNSHPIQGISFERPGNNDVLLEGNTSFVDANQDKAEDFLTGKSLLSKLGKKSLVLDENRRATYNLSNQPITRSESIFSTFESEIKHLVTVGLHAEYSYARSLARFAATLGPVAWKIASHRIQQAVPAGCKFGRGWVGEYEPLPTPVLMLDNRLQKEPSLGRKLQSTSESIMGDKNCKIPGPAKERPVNGPMFEGRQPSVGAASGVTTEGKPSLFGSPVVRPNAPVNVLYQQQNVQPRNLDKSENKGLKQVELNSLPSSKQSNPSLVANFSSGTPTAAAKPTEMVTRNMNILPSVPFKHLDTNGVVSGELPNGKVMNTNLNGRVTVPSSDGNTPKPTGRAAPYVSHGQDQSLSDPVHMMRMLAEKAQKHQASSNHSPVDSSSVTPPVSSGRRDDSSHAAAVAARAWMSGEFPPGGMPFQSEKNNFSFQALVPQAIHPGNVSQFHNRPMVFPQLAAADLSRFQMQSPRQGPSPRSQTPRQKQETLPPDLNIGFQSPGSPARQSSGVLVDSQQPDLALQL
ncbi:hypothetical protein L6164_029411 [Bauhinia variegata]|uniref:Uncharacterized protein n=1 Tax=Bauhinia variegata TaxID=167791 RepID=A0ACB9LAI8_BAUVA|nr:hypothetical protein L6164_029411 [Bauhinia variegata]